jgi:Tol biopolymer transport system component
MGRLATAVAVSAGALAVIYVAACVLPNGPSDAGRVQFTLDFSTPYRVPLAGVVEPLVTISADGKVLNNPAYRLESLDPSVVRVDSTERHLLGVARGTASVRVVYQTATGAPDTVFAVRVVVAQVAIDLSTLSFTRLGDTTRLKATAFDAHGAVVPNVAFTWSSSDTLLAWVDATGLVTALDEGSVEIAAEADSVKGVASVAVTQVAAAVQVFPETDTLHTVGRSVQFSAFAFDSTSAILPFAKAHWTSSAPAVARVDAAGLATATGGGTAKLIARVGAAADTATLVVQQVVRFLTVTPSLDTLTALADTSRIVALAQDSGTAPIPNAPVIWATNDPTIATVDPAGRVTAKANGVVLVTASSAGQSAFATVLVRQEVAKVQISADSVALAGQGDTVRLSATGLDRNGYPVVGAMFAWRSGSACVATVDSAGLVTAGGEGSAAIIATPANGGESDTALVSVAGAPSLCQHSIAFVSNRDGNSEIYVMSADGSGLQNLTNNPGSDGAPVWLLDGTRIAFVSDRDGNGVIYVMNADGSGLQNLTNNPETDGELAWSPGGTKIAFVSARDGNFEIYVMNVDGSGLQNLTNNPGGDMGPAWSPDGTRIAFVSFRGSYKGIYVMNADGSGVTPLVTSFAQTTVVYVKPVWSPDGSKIAYGFLGISCFRICTLATANIYVMNADGSGRQNLTNNLVGINQAPVWSPDGGRIAFARDPNRDGNPEIYVMNADGSGVQNLTNSPGNDYGPVWRPR